MGKSLNDNPFNDLEGFNINGIGISKEDIEANKNALKQIENIGKQKALINEDLDAKIKESVSINENVLDDDKQMDEMVERINRIAKKIKEDENICIKKTYIIKKKFIQNIEGLAILKQEQIKNIVNEVIKIGLDTIEERHNGILKEANKAYSNKFKDEDIF